MSEQQAPWREWLYVKEQDGTHTFVAPLPTVPGVPTRGDTFSVTSDHPASQYWAIRSKWATLGPDDFQAFYDKWAPKRDRALDPDESYLGKTRDEWQMFYTALADERQYRQHTYAQLDNLGGKAVLQAMSEARAQQAQLGGRSG